MELSVLIKFISQSFREKQRKFIKISESLKFFTKSTKGNVQITKNEEYY